MLEAELGSYKLDPVRESSPLRTKFEFQKNTYYLSASGRIIHCTVKRPIWMNGR
jgi:hypothetical protein